MFDQISRTNSEENVETLSGSIKLHFSIKNCVNLLSILHLGEHGSIKTPVKTKFKFKPRSANFIEVFLLIRKFLMNKRGIMKVSSKTRARDVINDVINQFHIQESSDNFHLYERCRSL